MAQIILGVVLTGGILYAGQFIALATWGTKFLIAAFVALILFSLLISSKKQDQWVFLRHINGEKLGKVEYGCVAFAAAFVLMAVFSMAYKFQIPTLFVTCIVAIAWSPVYGSVKALYEKAREKRLQAIVNYKENPPVSVSQQIACRLSSEGPEPVDKAIQEEALADIYSETEDQL